MINPSLSNSISLFIDFVYKFAHFHHSGSYDISPIQRIAIAEKYRSIYEKQAKENSLNNLKQNQASDKSNLTNRVNTKSTNEKLAEIANVKPTTYKMGAKILNSDNEEWAILYPIIQLKLL